MNTQKGEHRAVEAGEIKLAYMDSRYIYTYIRTSICIIHPLVYTDIDGILVYTDIDKLVYTDIDKLVYTDIDKNVRTCMHTYMFNKPWAKTCSIEL